MPEPRSIAFLGKAITATCQTRRQNAAYGSPAGTRKLILMARALARQGHEVHVFSPSYARRSDVPFVEKISDGLHLHHCPTLGLLGKLAILRKTIAMRWLQHELTGQAWDAVIGYNFYRETSIPLLAAKKRGSRILLDIEDGHFNEAHFQTAAYRKLEAELYHQADGFILVNEGLRERLEAICPGHARTFTLHGLFDPDVLKAAEGRVLPPVRRILYSGNFARAHGFAELITYIKALPPHLQLDITGTADAEEVRQIKVLAEARANVHYHGFLETQAFEKILQAADACLVLNNLQATQNRTNFPSKIFDYLARGHWVISTANPLLEPYSHLNQWLRLESIEADFPDIPQRAQARPPVADGLSRIAHQQEAALAAYLEGIIQGTSGLPAPRGFKNGTV